jgi:hypothetical protein
MTQVPLLDNETIANPYNRNKDYHDKTPSVARPSSDTAYDPSTHGDKPAEKVKEQSQAGAPQSDASSDEHDYKKRWSDLKKRYDTEVTTLRRQKAEVEDQVQEAAAVDTITLEAPKTPEELQRFMKEEPRLYELFKNIAKIEVQEDSHDVKEKLGEITKRELEFAKRKALRDITEAHSDFEEISKSDDFHNWAEEQIAEVQEWVYDNPTDGQKLIRAFDLYKADVSKLDSVEAASAAQTNSVVDASSIVSTRPTQDPVKPEQKVWTETDIRKMSLTEYDRLEPELDKAAREGRIVPG